MDISKKAIFLKILTLKKKHLLILYSYLKIKNTSVNGLHVKHLSEQIQKKNYDLESLTIGVYARV